MDKSWCLSYREFPEVFKTPLTFYPTFNMKAVVANQNMKLWATSFALVGCIHIGFPYKMHRRLHIFIQSNCIPTKSRLFIAWFISSCLFVGSSSSTADKKIKSKHKHPSSFSHAL